MAIQRVAVKDIEKAIELMKADATLDFKEALKKVRGGGIGFPGWPDRATFSEAVDRQTGGEMQKSKIITMAEEALAKGQRSVNGMDAQSIILAARADEIFSEQSEKEKDYGKALTQARGELGQ